MKVKCFGCDALIEADDADAVVVAFVAHGRESHNWAYPEEAIRNYARNYAEATERLTGDTERLSEIAEVTVHPVTEDRVDDWLRFFDHDAFADNPDWASCYCLEPHVPATPDNPNRHGATRARRWSSGCETARPSGISPTSTAGPLGGSTPHCARDYGLYRLVDPDGPAPQSVIGVSCFVIAPPFRRHGVAAALLDHVIADAAARGASWIEGYPHNKPEQATRAISAARARCTRRADSIRRDAGTLHSDASAGCA